MLTRAEREEFESRGVLRLPGAVQRVVAESLHAELRAHLAERGLVPERPAPGFAVNPSKLAAVANAHGFEEVWGTRALAAVDGLLGAGRWHVPKHAGQVLAMVWPQPDTRWELPHKSWHLDYRAPGGGPALPGLQLFLCLDRIEPRAGATLVAAGTPRLVDAIRRREGAEWPGQSLAVRRALQREVPWFRDLCDSRCGEDRPERFMQPSEAAEGSLEVLELVGEPGDVWVMHPWMVHAPAPNAGARPRLALTERIRARAAGLAAAQESAERAAGRDQAERGGLWERHAPAAGAGQARARDGHAHGLPDRLRGAEDAGEIDAARAE